MSELIRSESCQSGPVPARRPFCPALPAPQRKPTPMHPRRPRRHRLFHLSPWSPPLFRRDVRHVRNAEGLVALHGSVDDIDSIAAQNEIDKWSAGAAPALDLVLAHGVDEIMLFARTQPRKFAAAVDCLARIVNSARRSAIEVGIGRANIKDARLEAGLLPAEQKAADRRNGRCLLSGRRGRASLPTPRWF